MWTVKRFNDLALPFWRGVFYCGPWEDFRGPDKNETHTQSLVFSTASKHQITSKHPSRVGSIKNKKQIYSIFRNLYEFFKDLPEGYDRFGLGSVGGVTSPGRSLGCRWPLRRFVRWRVRCGNDSIVWPWGSRWRTWDLCFPWLVAGGWWGGFGGFGNK